MANLSAQKLCQIEAANKRSLPRLLIVLLGCYLTFFLLSCSSGRFSTSQSSPSCSPVPVVATAPSICQFTPSRSSSPSLLRNYNIKNKERMFSVTTCFRKGSIVRQKNELGIEPPKRFTKISLVRASKGILSERKGLK